MQTVADTPLTAEELAVELTGRGFDVGTVLAAGKVLLEQLPPHEAIQQVMLFVGQPQAAAPPWAGLNG